MNKQQRDELRAMHTPSTAQDDWSMCPNCRVPVQDCDVIKVLDYAESVLEELKSITAFWDGE